MKEDLELPIRLRICLRPQIPRAGNITQTRAVGTEGYMPAEQWKNQPRFNSDIYAAGIIGIQAITGFDISELNHHTKDGELIWRYPRDGKIVEISDGLVKELLRGVAQAQTQVNLGLIDANEQNHNFPGKGFLEAKSISLNNAIRRNRNYAKKVTKFCSNRIQADLKVDLKMVFIFCSRGSRFYSTTKIKPLCMA